MSKVSPPIKASFLPYTLALILTIALGLFSRRLPLPAELGDALWAVALYLSLRLFFRRIAERQTAMLAVVISFLVEFSQLLTWEWLVTVRSTILGHLLLGQGFLVQDLVAYSLGILSIYNLERGLQRKESRK